MNSIHGRSLSSMNSISLGPNQAFWEASIYAKYRKNLKKSNKIILNKQKYTVNPNNNIKSYNNSLFIHSNNNENNLTSNGFDLQNSKITESFLKNNENPSINKKSLGFKNKI